jgi:hypothetical protein
LKVTDHGTTCFTVQDGSGGFAVECQGKWSGLGSQTVLFTVSAPFSCENGGGNFPPGQQATGSQEVTPTNGQFTFDVTTNFINCHDNMTPTFGVATVCAQRTPPFCLTYAVRQ